MRPATSLCRLCFPFHLLQTDWDEETGILSIVFMTVGASTHRLAKLEAGDEIETCVGPLGKPQTIEKYGTVVIAMGCYGIGAVLPVARAMKQAGNRVIAIHKGIDAAAVIVASPT